MATLPPMNPPLRPRPGAAVQDPLAQHGRPHPTPYWSTHPNLDPRHVGHLKNIQGNSSSNKLRVGKINTGRDHATIRNREVSRLFPTEHRATYDAATAADQMLTRTFARSHQNTDPAHTIQIQGFKSINKRDGTDETPHMGTKTGYKLGMGDGNHDERQTFFQMDTRDFIDGHRLETVNREADDYIFKMQRELIGDRHGKVARDPVSGATQIQLPTTEHRSSIQDSLGRLSSNLFNTYQSLNPNLESFRTNSPEYTSQLVNEPNANIITPQYTQIAHDLKYMNQVDNPANPKWSGTLMQQENGNLRFTKTNDSMGVINPSGHPNNLQIDHASGSPTQGQINDPTANQLFYFNPVYSSKMINVSDEESANSLAHILRMFFDMQVLYYKKHVELLQVYQLLVIFFEKYNYSINALMYVLEHLIKIQDPQRPPGGYQVAMPIDFIRNIHLMLRDQKKMMNTVATLKHHLGMNKGGITGNQANPTMTDDNVLLSFGATPETDVLYADVVSREFGRQPAPNNQATVVIPAYYLPSFTIDRGDGTHIKSPIIDYMVDNANASYFQPPHAFVAPVPALQGAGAGNEPGYHNRAGTFHTHLNNFHQRIIDGNVDVTVVVNPAINLELNNINTLSQQIQNDITNAGNPSQNLLMLRNYVTNELKPKARQLLYWTS